MEINVLKIIVQSRIVSIAHKQDHVSDVFQIVHFHGEYVFNLYALAFLIAQFANLTLFIAINVQTTMHLTLGKRHVRQYYQLQRVHQQIHSIYNIYSPHCWINNNR
jgi:hypothetical protein